jgi:hypothetical protein
MPGKTQSEQGEADPQADNVPNLEQRLNKTVAGKILLHRGNHDAQPQPQPRSVVELAREQLNTGDRKSALADGIQAAVVPDCKDDAGLGLLGLPVIIYKAANGMP